MTPDEPAEAGERRALIIAFVMLGDVLLAGVVAVAAGLWLILGGVAEGTAAHRDLSRVVAIAAVAAGVLALASAAYVSRRGLWDRFPGWVRPALGGLLVAVVAASFLI